MNKIQKPLNDQEKAKRHEEQQRRMKAQASHNFQWNTKEWVCSVCGVTYDEWKTEARECEGYA